MLRASSLVLMFMSCLVPLDAHQPAADELAEGKTTASQRGDDAVVGAVDGRYNGRTIAKWIGDWDEGDYRTRREAIEALATVGAPAVDELATLRDLAIGDQLGAVALSAIGLGAVLIRCALPRIKISETPHEV